MYSSIEETSRKEVIQKCYWPLIKLADMGIPIGVEVSAVTLAIINELDPNWISSLSIYIAENKIEFIGSGYSQIIGPLVPAKVNEWNQKLGLEYYRKLLGVTPKVALVNEMAYSGGIVEHYHNAGYDGLIMEWNNPRSAHSEWENEWRYKPRKAIGTDGTTMPLIWADSIAFQKFQRYTHGEFELNEYIEYLKSHIGGSDRFFPVYSNDVEIFDYRPGRYHTEAQFAGNSEWDRITKLYLYLSEQDWCSLVFPSDVLKGLGYENSSVDLILESPGQPIPVKKQEKYNINRWALTGRDDLGINTKCYKIYNSFIENDNTDPNDWKELCYLWSSDFRTHITEKRWNNYFERLDKQLAKCNRKVIKESREITENVKISEDKKWVYAENNNYIVILNKSKGLVINKLVITKFGKISLLGTLNHGYYDDISLGADYYSGHAVIERLGGHKVTDLAKVSPVYSDNDISINSYQKHGDYSISQSVQCVNEKIIFEKIIEADYLEKTIIHPYSFTINPEAWDKDSLYIGTHNGGSTFEKYYLKDENISHGDIYSSLISARHGFGNTEGVFIVGDKDKSIIFKCKMSASALVPSIIYKEMDGVYFFRLQYSARERDETCRPNLNRLTIFSSLSISQL
jgi:hypothetical protein